MNFKYLATVLLCIPLAHAWSLNPFGFTSYAHVRVVNGVANSSISYSSATTNILSNATFYSEPQFYMTGVANENYSLKIAFPYNTWPVTTTLASLNQPKGSFITIAVNDKSGGVNSVVLYSEQFSTVYSKGWATFRFLSLIKPPDFPPQSSNISVFASCSNYTHTILNIDHTTTPPQDPKLTFRCAWTGAAPVIKINVTATGGNGTPKSAGIMLPGYQLDSITTIFLKYDYSTDSIFIQPTLEGVYTNSSTNSTVQFLNLVPNSKIAFSNLSDELGASSTQLSPAKTVSSGVPLSSLGVYTSTTTPVINNISSLTFEFAFYSHYVLVANLNAAGSGDYGLFKLPSGVGHNYDGTSYPAVNVVLQNWINVNNGEKTVRMNLMGDNNLNTVNISLNQNDNTGFALPVAQVTPKFQVTLPAGPHTTDFTSRLATGNGYFIVLWGDNTTHYKWLVLSTAMPSSGGGLSGGAIAGIIIGVLFALILIGAAVYCFRSGRGPYENI